MDGLSKKQRGRYKKLRKRAAETKQGCDFSGLASDSEWSEWLELTRTIPHDVCHVGPCVRRRRFNQNHNQQQRGEGTDHRNIINGFIHKLGGSQWHLEKLHPTVPSWATLHNPCSFKSLVVIELNFSISEEPWDAVLSKIPVLKELVVGRGNHKGLQVETRWFQGNKPKSISEILMYTPVEKTHFQDTKRRKLSSQHGESYSTMDLVSSLRPLALTMDQMSRQGFPQRSHAASDKQANTRCSCVVQGPSPLEDAAAGSTNSNQTKVQIQDESCQYVKTTPSSKHEPSIFALDCEMVRSVNGPELARATLLKFDRMEGNDVIYSVVVDKLVKPREAILDYLTAFSGIGPHTLDGVTTRLEHVQALIVSLLHENDVLVGHSLENDLRALKLIHESFVVDTATLFETSNGRKYSLKHLAGVLLGKRIQSDSLNGHCSEEDAAACLQLAVRRALDGSSFRVIEPTEHVRSIFSCLNDMGKPAVCVGPSHWLQEHVTQSSTTPQTFMCESIDGSTNHQAVFDAMGHANVIWANVPVNSTSHLSDSTNRVLTGTLDKMVPGTLLLLALQQGYSHSIAVTTNRRSRKDPRATLGWSEDDEASWREDLKTCQKGLAFWIGMEGPNE